MCRPASAGLPTVPRALKLLPRPCTIQSFQDESHEAEAKLALPSHRVMDIIKEVFLEVDREVSADASTGRSGSTCSMLVHVDDRLFIANVGDSRATVVDSLGRTLLLSDEHSYGAPDGKERERLDDLCNPSAGGDGAGSRRISPSSGWRIKVIDDERITMVHGITHVEYDGLPGQDFELERLAPTRAFGHTALKGAGLLIAEPTITVLELRPCEEYTVLLASDGIWDMCSRPEEVWRPVADCDDEVKAQAVVDWATQRWQQFWTYEFNGQAYGQQRIPSPDDCSAIVLTLRANEERSATLLDQLEAEVGSAGETDDMSSSFSEGLATGARLLQEVPLI